ncbi:MAG: hypothetical protein ACFCGT_11725 [Sandaracinaceae bacterium]
MASPCPHTRIAAAFLLLALAGACSAPEEPDAGSAPDGGVEDAGVDAARPDAGADRDAGRLEDAGPDGPDAGRDAGPDLGADGGPDAGPDLGADGGPDAGPDLGVDAGVDAGPDLGVDAGADAGPDLGVDAGPDAGPFDAGPDAGPFDAGLPPGGCLSDGDCLASEFCNYPIGTCGGVGTCTVVPGACPLVFDPQCGCDGMTYGNACEAAARRQSIRMAGACSP